MPVPSHPGRKPAMLCLAVVPLLLGPGAATWHALRRIEQPVKSFDRSVLGNLREVGEVAAPRLARGHTFVVDITVGTPPQLMSCLVDTGSADLWIPSKRCKSCVTKHHFHADKSSTFIPDVIHTPQGNMPVPVEVNAAGGQIVGFSVQDRIGLGPWVFNNQSFLIVEESDMPRHRSWDGICGFGWKGADARLDPLYKNLQKTRAKATFALVPSAPGQTWLAVGEVPHQFVHSVAWTQAERLGGPDERSFWVASGAVGTSRHNSIPARFVIDTGTPFMLVPPRHYISFLRSIFPRHLFEHLCGVDTNGDNLVVCSCHVMDAGMKPVVLHIAGQTFTLEVEKLFKRVPTKDGGELCLLHIQQNSMVSPNPLDLLSTLLGGPLGLNPGKKGRSPRFPSGGPFQSGGPGGPMPPPPIPPFFLPPFLLGQAAGIGNGPPLPTGQEQIEEVTQTLPNGTVCTTTLVWLHQRLKSNTTSCHRRRLQFFQPLVQENNISQMWVLGSAVLEHFMTVLDFENHRIGFGEIIAHPDQAADTQSQSLMTRQRMQRVSAEQRDFALRPHAARTPPATMPHALLAAPAPMHHQGGAATGQFPWGWFLLLTFVLAPVVWMYVIYRKMKTRRALAEPLGQEGDEAAELFECNEANAAVAE